jgi:hypothetical protein
VESSTWVSPHYTHGQIDLESASLEDRIAILEDRVRGYFTTPSRLLTNIYENSIFLVLLAIFSSVELIETLHRGSSSKGSSEEFFKSGFKRIFKPQAPKEIPPENYERDLDKVLSELYVQARCGLMHLGTTRSKVVVSKQLNAPLTVEFDQLKAEVTQIVLNPNAMLLALDLFLSDYCRDLRNQDNSEMRQKFDSGWVALGEEG